MKIVRIGAGAAGPLPSADVVGAKAANLAQMAALGLPVPSAFVLPVSLCAAIVRGDADARQKLRAGLAEGIAFLEQATGRTLGDRRRPLLVSVRSGAARSMPGMLDTVLDVGCTASAVRGLIRSTGNPRFAWDCRRRFLESFCTVVLGVPPGVLDAPRASVLAGEGARCVEELDGEALERLARAYVEALDDDGNPIPAEPVAQLEAAAQAVYGSWMGERARTYRQLEHLEHLQGTAVTVQAMVFGNRGLTSGSGVAFSRDPSTGAAVPVIDVLFEAQGEDVVSGSRSPQTEDALMRVVPEAGRQLRDVLVTLERAFRDVQDVEFTIEDGRLWMLQTRSAKRTPRAALRIAIDLVRGGLIAPAEGVARLAGLDPASLVERRLTGVGTPLTTGTGASAGVAVGRVAFSSQSAQRYADGHEPVILVRPDTSTSDVAGFSVSAGIVTAVGGRTAHAALVARQMGKPCVAGCRDLVVDVDRGCALVGETVLREGDWLSVDGGAGRVFTGRGSVEVDRLDEELATVAGWQVEAEAPV
ncbi:MULTISPECIES: PEP/pyruvate-binding domain-containing protein [unclassified Xanthobacter]|uniref:PEP/pyruvate-binding domain-containing protein n=1 Tax=unclassified Xanthobacter TaxID=2623496 RepID=UPI001EDE791F|nr:MULTISPECIES: PEP/pyruvate-binding domain-containing protein [unclassified Xanthobacter]